MSNARFVSFASVISEIQQSDMFMTVKARILETPKANLNGARVTAAFVDEIISNEARYVGLPLYADVKALKGGKYNRLGHLYNSRTGEFHSTQIGSFYEFAKEEFDGGCYLVGYARIPKRDKQLAKAIAELFAENALKFSFEISCGEYTELNDGTFEIDASENNFLEGTAIVTFPACEEAVALEFVAQRADLSAEADDTERGETEMAENKEVVAEEVKTAETAQPETEVENTEVAELENAETVETENVETETAEVDAKAEEVETETAETEEAACKDKQENAEVSDKETAAVYVTETHREEVQMHAYDTETGKEVHQEIEVSTSTSEPVEGNLVEADDGIHIAEAGDEAASDTPAETPAENPAETPAETTPTGDTGANAGANEPAQEKTGDAAVEDVVLPEDNSKKLAEQIEALANAVKTLTAEVETLKEASKTHVAASKNVTAEVNPFIDDINAGRKFGLLEKAEFSGNNYTLLS